MTKFRKLKKTAVVMAVMILLRRMRRRRLLLNLALTLWRDSSRGSVVGRFGARFEAGFDIGNSHSLDSGL